MRSTVTFVGNVVREPRLRATPGGAVAGFRIAVEDGWRDKRTQEWVSRSIYLEVSAWRELGEHVADSVVKGQPVIVVGRLRQREYDDRDGVRRTVVELEADAVGHDLSRGTARFARTPRGPQTAEVAALERAYAEPAATSSEPTAVEGLPAA
ncbi:MAG: single-stranded DNA-binding protein [Candidatus Nanopelagicales bacterium]